MLNYGKIVNIFFNKQLIDGQTKTHCYVHWLAKTHCYVHWLATCTISRMLGIKKKLNHTIIKLYKIKIMYMIINIMYKSIKNNGF